MASYCLVPAQADKFKKALISGEIDPAKLAVMTSAQRQAFFATIIGKENAAPVNALFESKLLLKNQQLGMISWAKKVVGISAPVRRDMIAKIERLDKVLNPAEEKAFLADLAAQRLGVGVSYDEAAKISELSKKIKELAPLKGGERRMEYGRAVVELRNYLDELKESATRFTIADAKADPALAVRKVLGGVASNSKAIKASMDNSALFRQGWKTMITNPGIWRKNAVQSFRNIWATFGKKAVMDELKADIVSRPNFELMQRAKLAVSVIEEAYPTSLPEKIPVLGRLYKASETAYSAFLTKTRADVFDKYIEIAQRTGVELNDAELKSIGSLVNSLTGRGNLGPAEPVANVVNNVFFSLRSLKAQVDTFLQPITGAGGSAFVRKQAAINLLKIVSAVAAILGTAKIIAPDSVELDPRSSDFGKIRVGNTRFDVTGGLSTVVVLATRLIRQSTKSSTTKKVTPLNSGKFGSQTGVDVVYNFFENKLSPAAAVARDLLRNQTFEGDKPTVANEAANLFVPLPIMTIKEAAEDEKAADLWAVILADSLGITASTYSPKKKK